MDKAVVTAALASCLLTDEEFALGPEGWEMLEDPFSELIAQDDLTDDEEDEEDDDNKEGEGKEEAATAEAGAATAEAGAVAAVEAGAATTEAGAVAAEAGAAVEGDAKKGSPYAPVKTTVRFIRKQRDVDSS